jgi:hypothetical protein
MSTAVDRLVKKVRPELEAAAAAENLQAVHRHVGTAIEILKPFAAKRVKIEKPPPPGRSREERRAEEDSIEAKGKKAAKARAGGICEWHTFGRRCHAEGTDADHVLGGRWKSDMEALPNGEGFMWECRFHHDIKHGPGKPESLAVAKEHALRIGSKGLLRHVELAAARFEARNRPSIPIRVVVR